jgi:nickel-dependent lactate racemase
MSIFATKSGKTLAISDNELRQLIKETLDKAGSNFKKALLIPPDITRVNSYAGPITAMIYEMLAGKRRIDIIPALGTHAPMTEHELRAMFGPNIPLSCFKVHDWRNDVVKKGVIPGSLLKEWS